jgi:hypothetical protein
MSTPINALPLKTSQTNMSDTNDINDPLVQDVLNEFQEELMISKKNAQPSQHMHQAPPMMIPSQQQYNNPQYQQQHLNYKNNANKSDYSSYLDVEVAKKSLILVIISLIIYNSGIINTVYEKLPDYLHDNLNNFDIYIKSLSLFAIIYVLSFFEYI